MLVVADTSALVALAACDALATLDQLFKKVRVPTAVFEECTVIGKPESARLRTYLEGKVVEVDIQEVVIAAGRLGQGELEAMALYRRLHADFLLLDDHRARKVARLRYGGDWKPWDAAPSQGGRIDLRDSSTDRAHPDSRCALW